MLLQRLKLVGFIYIQGSRHKDISSRSTELMYQLRRHDDVLVYGTGRSN